MKNIGPQSRAERSMRLVFAAGVAVLASCACVAPADAVDATHWLTPSVHAVQKGTLSDSGIPKSPSTSVPAAPARLAKEGTQLYGMHCATCHGADLQGARGVPSLLTAGGAAVDFYLTTGRMPLADKSADQAVSAPAWRIIAAGTQAYHVPALLNANQRAAINAYVSEHGTSTTPIPTVKLDPMKLQAGRQIFEANCEACHGAAAQGATAGYQWTALSLQASTPTQIGEALRIGPGVMPRFPPTQLSDDDVDAVATYVRYLATENQNYGGTVMWYLGPVAEGAVGAVVGVGFLFWVVYFTGTKADGRRV
ncbi:MAG: c-type cytochrome, partial [Candidatus Eremiobacteraeota bacterium]|nr:c-type cytochrome [Candidatus Eremiobacteraeota bacterium]